VEAFRALRANDVDVVTLGQYMRPTKKHMAVEDYVTPEAFAAYQVIGVCMWVYVWGRVYVYVRGCMCICMSGGWSG
jgi:lipoate synthase